MQSLPLLSNARAYFEHIEHQPDRFAFLAAIPNSISTEPVFEEEWLDFKGNPQDDKDAKRIWSKALSGYANITDGLIVWGIDARKTQPKNIDAACGLRLIPEPEAFESKLREWIRDATNPPVRNVEYRSVRGPNGLGFVVCLIPQSRHRPHRAEFADKQYYYRAGDDFLVAEPSLLRLFFYPELEPHLEIEATLSYEFSHRNLGQEYRKSQSVNAFNLLLNSSSSMSLAIQLHNTGAVSAKDVYVVLQVDIGLKIYEGSDWMRSANPRGQVAFRAKRPFHPGEVTELFSASFQRSFPNRTVEPNNDMRIIPNFDEVRLQFLLYAENYQGEGVAVTFVPEDLNFESGTAIKGARPLP